MEKAQIENALSFRRALNYQEGDIISGYISKVITDNISNTNITTIITLPIVIMLPFDSLVDTSSMSGGYTEEISSNTDISFITGSCWVSEKGSRLTKSI